MADTPAKILVVDDNPDNRDLISRRLQRSGYEVDTAEDGWKALEAIEAQPYDAVLLDVMMPGIDGFEVLRRVRTTTPQSDLPIIIVTAKHDSESIVTALEAGANDYVSKPIDFKVLRARLRNQVALKRAEEALKSVNETLEATVEQRTADLLKANSKLTEEIKERIHASEELKKKEQHLQGLIDCAPDGVVTLSEGGFITGFSPAAQKIFGFEEHEVLGKPVSQLLSPEYELNHDEFVKRFLVGPESLDLINRASRDIVAVKADGRRFPVAISLGDLGTGQDSRFVSVVRDITERKRNEAELHQSHERTQMLLESVADGVVGLDGEGRIAFMNPAARDALKSDGGSCSGKYFLDCVQAPAKDTEGPAAVAIMESAFRDGKRSARHRSQFKDFRNNIVDVEFVAPPLWQNDQLVGAVVAFNDITERLKTEAQLRQAGKMEAIGRLTGGVAHDFNNVLTVIIGNLQLLERRLASDENSLARIEKVLAAANSAGDLTKRLLGFSRQQVLETNAVDVNDTVARMTSLLKRSLGSNVAIESALDEALPLARANSSELENAVLNLCINARDAMPDGGRLIIETKTNERAGIAHEDGQTAQFVELAISDNGCGMSAETKEKIFEPFFTTKGVGKGTGLGLASVFSFVNQAGGDISVYSEVGVGTTFRLHFPVASEMADQETKGGTSADKASFEGLTVLVVDDEPDVREFAVAALSELGCTTLEAANADDALEIYARTPHIDVVLSDIVMPGSMDGVALAHKLRHSQDDLAIVLASGFTERRVKNGGDLPERCAFLSKPYRIEEIARLLPTAKAS